MDEKHRVIYLIFAAFSLVFIVFSRPVQLLYLLLFIPLFIKIIIDSWGNKKKLLIDLLPALSIVVVGAVIVCVMNYLRFDSIFEFGEHYQLTVIDCRSNSLKLEGLYPTFYHYYFKPPELVKDTFILSYSDNKPTTDVHPYITSSVGMFFVPVCLFIFFIPFVIRKDDSLFVKLFLILSPILIFFLSWYSYCFAGVCPRYLLDFIPFASLLGGIVALKLVDQYKENIPVLTPGISIFMIISIVLTSQYHFIAFDGLKIGDFGGLYSILKSIFNRFNI